MMHKTKKHKQASKQASEGLVYEAKRRTRRMERWAGLSTGTIPQNEDNLNGL